MKTCEIFSLGVGENLCGLCLCLGAAVSFDLVEALAFKFHCGTTLRRKFYCQTLALRRRLAHVSCLLVGRTVGFVGGIDDTLSGICLFGDLIAATMAKRGCHGAVVDGGFRDLEAISGTGFPVFARYVSPVQSVGRWRVTRHAEPIVVRGALGGLVTVSPDDLVLGDEDGVVVVQAERVREVLERAEAIVRQEAEARKLSEEGMTAQEMLERFGHV